MGEDAEPTVQVNELENRMAERLSGSAPYASEFGIEPGRPLGGTHRELYATLFSAVNGGRRWPSRYPAADGAEPWLACGRHGADVMIERLRREDLDAMERARHNLGYHWAMSGSRWRSSICWWTAGGRSV